MSNLKPCPFCGTEPNHMTSELGNRPCFYYECENPKCGATEFGWHNTEQEAINAWNTRPIEDALRKEIAQLQARIAELEADNANLNDWLNAWKESFSLAQVEIAKLKADNRSLVEQMNAMALEMGGGKMLTLTSCYKNYIKLCSDFGFALGSMKATLFYLLETYSGDDDTAKLRKDIMETTDKLRLAVTETQIFVENLLINIMRN